MNKVFHKPDHWTQAHESIYASFLSVRECSLAVVYAIHSFATCAMSTCCSMQINANACSIGKGVLIEIANLETPVSILIGAADSDDVESVTLFCFHKPGALPPEALERLGRLVAHSNAMFQALIRGLAPIVAVSTHGRLAGNQRVMEALAHRLGDGESPVFEVAPQPPAKVWN